ncbi:MAG TPA: Ig-like domain-containing protein [Candidatus Saccharimonadales bacterium]|nr:Ig-like domain-containing protein [Candidatus Saccharimonadales bacterium]
MEGDNMTIGQEPEKFEQKRRIPKLPMIVVALFVGLVGGFVLISSFAATTDSSCDQTVSSASAAQSAVSAATPGQAVCLSDGTYGNLTLNTNKANPGVTLQAQNPGKATIGAVSISGAGITVSNFNTTGEITVQPGSSNITILHNKITGGYFGVDACNSTTTTCNDVKIIGNKFQGPYGEDAIRANRYHDVDGDGFGLTVSQNEFTGIIENGEHSDCLQTVWVGDGIDFDHNYEHDNHCQGFFIKDQNSLCGPGVTGVCGTVTNVKVYDNIFTRNSEPCAATAPDCGPDTTIQLFGPEDKVSIDRNTMWGGDLTFTLRDPGWSNVSVTNNVLSRAWTDTTAPFNSTYTSTNNLFCNTNYAGSYPSTGFTSNCNPPFPGPTAAGGDNFMLGGSQGVDWKPSQYTYGPVASTSSAGDTTAPTVSVTAPSSGSTVSGSVNVTANASDDTGVAGVQFKLDGNNLGSEDTSSPYSATWNTATASNGTHTLTAVARDAAGNTKTSASVTVTVNNTSAGGGNNLACTSILSVGANIQNALSSASPGSVICLSAGTWSAQTFSGIAPSGTVTLQPVPGATVHVKGITINGPGNTKNLTVQGLYIDGGVQGLCGIDGNVVFQYNTIQHINAGNAFYFYANGCGGSHVQTGVSMLHNQMDHVGECLTVAGGASIEKNFTFKNNVCGPDIGAGVTKGNQYSHYIEIGCMAGGTFDNNAFIGPYDATALSNSDTATAVHNNVFHCFGDGSNISFSNNILWHTQSRAQTVLIQSGKMDNITIHNNLFVNDPACRIDSNNCPAQDIEVYATHGLNVTNNTVVATAWGLHFPSVCNDGCYASGTDNTLSNNIVEAGAVDGNADYSEWGCASSCTTSQNVSYDGSAVGSSSVKNWTPSYTSTTWTPHDGEPYAAPPSGYYVAKGLPFLAGWNGNGGPEGGVGASATGSSGGGSSSADTTNPTVSIASPSNGSTVSGIVTATASASDNVGVTKVEISVDGSLKIADTSAPYNYSFDSKTISNGSHTISAKAYDAAGNSSSSSVTVTVNNPDTTPPSAPTNVNATAASATTVSLGWSASTDSGPNATGVAKYNVLRNGVVLAQVTGTSYTDSTAVASTPYSYVVQAVDGAGNVSSNSTAAAVTTPSAPDTTPPTTPTGLKASATSATQVNLSWNASTDTGGSGLAGYNVYRDGTQLNTAPITGISYKDAKASPNTTYQYAVQAVDKAGNTSDKSSTADVSTPAAPTSGGGSSNGGSGGHHGHKVPVVRITIYDNHHHLARGAIVILQGQTRRTNSQGIVQFNNVPAGKQNITVDYGRHTVTKKVNVTPAKHGNTQHLKVSLASATTNPALLLVPVVILIGAALVIFRPWGNKLASAIDEPLKIVTSDQQPGGDNKSPQTPGAVYTPQPTDKDKKL